MKLIPLTRRARLAFIGVTVTITALALLGTAVVIGPTEAYRLGLALCLVAAFNLALVHNLKQAHAISRRARRKNP
jgi:hypothetical protein